MDWFRARAGRENFSHQLISRWTVVEDDGERMQMNASSKCRLVTVRAQVFRISRQS